MASWRRAVLLLAALPALLAGGVSAAETYDVTAFEDMV